MRQRCIACAHEARDDIDQALARGSSLRAVGTRFGISASAVQRHASRHVRPALRQAIERQGELRIGTLAEHLADLLGSAAAVRARAMEHGDPVLVLRAVDSERGVLADLARLVGHDFEGVRAELAESAALANAVVELVRRDPHLTELLTAELELAGSVAASDLAEAFCHLESTRPRPALAAIAARD